MTKKSSEVSLQKNKKYIIIAAAIIVLLVLGKMLLSTNNHSSAEVVAKAFVNAMEKKNQSAYIKCFPPEIQDDISAGLKEMAELERNGDVYSTNQQLKDGWYPWESPYRLFYEAEDVDLEYALVEIEEISDETLYSINQKYGINVIESCCAVITVSRSYSFSLQDGQTETDTYSSYIYAPLGKIGEKWYVIGTQRVDWSAVLE